MLLFFPITRTSFPRRPAYLIAMPRRQVFVFLVVGSKGVLVKQHQFRVIRARFRELRKLLPDGCDQAGLPLHAFVTVHRATRIADSELARLHRARAFCVIIRHVIDPSARGPFSTVLFFRMQLLREVSADAHFLDGMKLSVQKVRVPFFVLQHALK